MEEGIHQQIELQGTNDRAASVTVGDGGGGTETSLRACKLEELERLMDGIRLPTDATKIQETELESLKSKINRVCHSPLKAICVGTIGVGKSEFANHLIASKDLLKKHGISESLHGRIPLHSNMGAASITKHCIRVKSKANDDNDNSNSNSFSIKAILRGKTESSSTATKDSEEVALKEGLTLEELSRSLYDNEMLEGLSRVDKKRIYEILVEGPFSHPGKTTDIFDSQASDREINSQNGSK